MYTMRRRTCCPLMVAPYCAGFRIKRCAIAYGGNVLTLSGDVEFAPLRSAPWKRKLRSRRGMLLLLLLFICCSGGGDEALLLLLLRVVLFGFSLSLEQAALCATPKPIPPPRAALPCPTAAPARAPPDAVPHLRAAVILNHPHCIRARCSSNNALCVPAWVRAAASCTSSNNLSCTLISKMATQCMETRKASLELHHLLQTLVVVDCESVGSRYGRVGHCLRCRNQQGRQVRRRLLLLH